MRLFYYTYELEIPHNGEFEYVELHAEMDVEPNEIIIGEILWDKEKYTPAENKMIDEYIDNHLVEIEKDICKAYNYEVKQWSL